MLALSRVWRREDAEPGFLQLRSLGDPVPVRNSLRVVLLLALFLATFFSCMSALFFRGGGPRMRLALSLLSCLGGGVFLATCLLDLVPDCVETFEQAHLSTKFPLAEFLIAIGLLSVLLLEQLILALKEAHCAGADSHHHEEEQETPLVDGEAVEPPPSKLRAVLLLLALSTHALFEGLSLATIDDVSKLLQIFVGLLVHKTVVGLSLGVRLVAIDLRLLPFSAGALLFSSMGFLGGVAGISLIAFLGGGDSARLVSGALTAFAAGTFLYITTFEVLPHELTGHGPRLPKMAALFAGFLLIALFIFLYPEDS